MIQQRRYIILFTIFTFLFPDLMGTMTVLPGGKTHKQPEQAGLFFTGNKETILQSPQYGLACVNQEKEELQGLCLEKAHIVTSQQDVVTVREAADNPLYQNVILHIAQLSGSVIEVAAVLEEEQDTVYWVHEINSSVLQDTGVQATHLSKHIVTIPGKNHVTIQKLYSGGAIVYALCSADGEQYVVGLHKKAYMHKKNSNTHTLFYVEQLFAKKTADFAQQVGLSDDSEIVALHPSAFGVYAIFENKNLTSVFPVALLKAESVLASKQQESDEEEETKSETGVHIDLKSKPVFGRCHENSSLPSQVSNLSVMKTSTGLSYLVVAGKNKRNTGIWTLSLVSGQSHGNGLLATYTDKQDIKQKLNKIHIEGHDFFKRATDDNPVAGAVQTVLPGEQQASLFVEGEALFAAVYNAQQDCTTLHHAQALFDAQGAIISYTDWKQYAQYPGKLVHYIQRGAGLNTLVAVNHENTLKIHATRWIALQKTESLAYNIDAFQHTVVKGQSYYSLGSYNTCFYGALRKVNTQNESVLQHAPFASQVLQSHVEDNIYAERYALEGETYTNQELGFVSDIDVFWKDDTPHTLLTSSTGIHLLVGKKGDEAGTSVFAVDNSLHTLLEFSFASKLKRSAALYTWYILQGQVVYKLVCTQGKWKVIPWCDTSYYDGCTDLALCMHKGKEYCFLATGQGVVVVDSSGEFIAQQRLPYVDSAYTLQLLHDSTSGLCNVYVLAVDFAKHQSDIIRYTCKLGEKEPVVLESIFGAPVIDAPNRCVRFGETKTAFAWFGHTGYIAGFKNEHMSCNLIFPELLSYISEIQYGYLQDMKSLMSSLHVQGSHYIAYKHDPVMGRHLLVDNHNIYVLV